MGRKKIVAGNWKMNKIRGEARTLVDGLLAKLSGVKDVDIVVCPPFTALETANSIIKGTNIKLGAQDCYWEPKGAYTGEIPPEFLLDAGCEYCIIGHSERRQFFNECDCKINKKAFALYRAGIKPIICIGETLADRKAEKTEKILEEQIRGCVNNIPTDKIKDTVIAYEPVWAIGTGVTANNEQIQKAHGFIRSLLAKIYNKDIADCIRIQYGGSVTADNAKEIFAISDVDGGLIGGASLTVDAFTAIVNAAK